MAEDTRKPLAISMGEPAGIGPDLILRAFALRDELKLPPFAVYGSRSFLAARAERLGMDLPFAAIEPGEAAAAFSSSLPVVEVEGLASDTPGHPSALSAPLVIDAIARAVGDTLLGRCRAIITAPIHKAALTRAGFEHPGHTEYLAALCATGGRSPMPVMMLAHEDLRAVPLTIHVPLEAVPGLIEPTLVLETVRIVERDLRRRFGIAHPRIGVCGLNPHAGESGTIGRQELEIIAPAIARLAHEGFSVEGPLPADTLFYPPHWRRYDAVVAMYHDQALIPIKTVAFEDAVNVTLGLPIVRTSPDHGTAFDIAGTGQGSHASFVAAIKLADRMSGART